MTLTHNKKYTEKTKKAIKNKKKYRGEELMDTSKLYALSNLSHNKSDEGCELNEIIWNWRCNDR